MPIYHDVAQYSEAYDRLKLGIPTSSHFHKIITPQGKPSKQWREYACVLIAERILQRRLEFYNSPAMERGLIVEADAADWYEFDQDVTAQKSASSPTTITPWDAVPIGSSAMTGCWKSRPRCRIPRSHTGFSGRSTSASGRSCKDSSTFRSAAGSISYPGTTCFPRWSSGSSLMRSLSQPSTANCRSSTILSSA